jgi:hypothetical protein
MGHKKKSGPNKYGWVFEAVIDTQWKDHPEMLDCALEWWEWQTIIEPKARVPDTPRTWTERKTSPTLAPWGKRKKECGKAERTPIEDWAFLPVGDGVEDAVVGKQDLFIAIKIISAMDCMCDKEQRIALLHLQFETVRLPNGKVAAKRGDPRSGEEIEEFPDPPGNPPRGEWPKRSDM